MQFREEVLSLPEGEFRTEIIAFDQTDIPILKDVYDYWRELCNKISKIGGRYVNLPESLSEAAFCQCMNSVKLFKNISGANSSFDAYDLERKKRIQVKGCSVVPDLTSFGPRSQWDELYFVDFYRDGKFDGQFDVYLIPNELIYNFKINASQTFLDQQRQGRRPRLSIFRNIIIPNQIKPIKTCSLY